MKTVVIFYPLMVIGGNETLIIRLINWYEKNLFDVILLTEEPIQDSTLLKDISNNYYFYNKKAKYFSTEAGTKLSFDDRNLVLILSFTFIDLFKCYKWFTKKEYQCRFTYRIYIVHPFSNYIFSSKIKFLNLLIRPLIRLFLKRRIIFFMDEEVHNDCYNRYKITENNGNNTIVRLPMEIKDFDIIKQKDSIINILTVSRFDFPFKAYILGLIDSFKSIALTNQNVTLTIIGYGNGEAVVRQRIMTLKENIKNRINLINKVPYSEIDRYIDQCDLFVGMGTTILDAANRNKISITAVAFQENDYSLGFFHDDFTKLGEIFNKDHCMQYLHFSDLIRQIINIDNKTYIEKGIFSKYLLKNYFNIEINASKLIEDTCLLSDSENFKISFFIFLYSIYTSCITLLRPIYKLFKYRKTNNPFHLK
jgi:hypothetical protein